MNMRPFKFLFFLSYVGLCHLPQVKETGAVTPPRTQEFRDFFNLKSFATPKEAFQISTLTNPRKALLKSQNYVSGKQIQRRDIPFQQTFLGVPVQIENVKQTHPIQGAPPRAPTLPKVAPVKPLIKPNETEAERAERIHRSFDRLLTFVEIVGQVDNYVSSKWKNLVKTVSNFYETEDDPYRVSSKRIYGPCPHAQ